ncbi:MAG: hypothetical protein HZA46_08160 [Planctomycetales bacterium]|nr:hypothetical protein [Planctomycetales bacterium]
MQKCLMSLWAVAFGLVVVGGWAMADDKDKPKHSIKDVMKTAMKGGLCKKVGDGSASDAEKKELLALFESLGKNKPPKGEEKSWKEKSEALVNAAKAAVDGKADAADQLKKAANCGACHKDHKAS